MKNLFTSESVTCGHPDKVCDQVADRILDEILEQDPEAHTAIEVTAATDQMHIFGEVTTDAKVDYEEVARNVISEIGYTMPGRGFDAENCKITIDLHKQSPDIAMGIHRRGESDELNNGAGDQGLMFGYACKDSQSLMPLPIELAHSLAKRLEQVRRTGELPYLLPDGKTQVTVEFNNGKPVAIPTVILSTQHREDVDMETLRKDITDHVIRPTLPRELLKDDMQIFINPTGRFVIGGPAGDSGLTGRKLIVDTYGGYARHGGGSFSGKDPSKVDRSGAYMARYLAKNVVSAGLAKRCEVQLAYSIGLAEPVSVLVDTFGTGEISDQEIQSILLNNVDLRPGAIIQKFDLKRPIYSQVSCYGHFGSNASQMPWEQTNLI